MKKSRRGKRLDINLFVDNKIEYLEHKKIIYMKIQKYTIN